MIRLRLNPASTKYLICRTYIKVVLLTHLVCSTGGLGVKIASKMRLNLFFVLHSFLLPLNVLEQQLIMQIYGAACYPNNLVSTHFVIIQ